MTPEPGNPQHDLDNLRAQLHQLREGGSLHALLAHLGGDEPVELSSELELVCQVLEVLTAEDWGHPRELPDSRLAAIAETTGIEPDRVASLLGRLVTIARTMRDIVAPSEQEGSAQGRDGTPRPAALIRRIDLFTLLTRTQRTELWYRWNLMARVGCGPAYDRPLFAAWNRNLRLFDWLADPKPAITRGGRRETRE